MSEILSRLGNPHLKVPKVIHVAGTNGKGSTTSYIGNILRKAGYKVHTYISPHLINFNERIILDGKEISDQYLFEIMERCRIAAEQGEIVSDGNVGMTLFEATTAAAFIAFAEVPADFLVLEVGMGGRLDATNVIENTILSIITPVDIDHAEFLGNTITEIAHEKAGIMKKNIPCIISQQTEEGAKVLEYHASLLKAPIFRFGKEYGGEEIPSNNKSFNYYHIDHETHEKINITEYPVPSLIGPHQIENVSTAIAAIENLVKHGHCNVYYEDICEAITTTYWPARLEPIIKGKIFDMVPKNWEIFLDGAHNPHGAKGLARWAETRKDKKLYIVFGTTKGKDVAEYLKILKPYVEFVCGICVEHETNAQRGTVISEAAAKLGMPTKPFDFLPNAIKYITENESDPSIILICGSLYLAGDVMKINNNMIFAD
jgi:dihydrofolate synthase/folylpolyglutamate synthase